jgi:hypothetical protein
MSRFLSNGGTRRRAVKLAAATSILLFPALAHAHFNLQQPPNWTTETTTGDPEKDWPCGNENNPMSTGPTTAFKPGDKVTIELAETIMHPGHYRVALATSGNMMDLPMDMSRTDSGMMCENDDMQSPPVFPVLADGMLEHTQKLNGVQSFDVTLPSDVTCDKCVLQVREYMQGHSSAPETATQTNGCYYHHCAYISIKGTTGAGGMSGSGGAANGGMSAGGMSAGGALGMSGASNGGAMGEAGTATSSGGAPGSAGSPGGAGKSGAGAPGTGGSLNGTGGSATPGTGGTSTNNGAAGSGVTGTGGTGTGGSTTSPGAGTTSSGGTKGAPAPAAGDDSGGGCNLSTHGTRAPFGFAGALGLGLWFVRRRRR